MNLSIVVPAFNEAENLESLVREIAKATAALPVAEIMIVDDCSDDDTAALLAKLKKEIPLLRYIRHVERSGQSTALWNGIARAKGILVVTLDGDGQNDPADIPLLFDQYKKQAGTDGRVLVAGQRRKRHDNLVRRLSSRGANFIRSSILRDGVRDTGCSLKLFRRDDFTALPFFNHLHRFIPALMKARGVQIVLVDVSHRPRLRGVSKYGFWDRLWVGIADLIGVRWLLFRLKPPTGVLEP